MPLNNSDTWELRRKSDDVLIGKLTFKSADFPWHICDFQPTALFDQYQHLFVEESEFLDSIALSDSDEDWTTYFDKYQEILDILKLVAVGNAFPVDDIFILHIYDKEAHFRA